MRYRLRTLLILMAVGPIALAGLVFVAQDAWDGRFNLSVHFLNKTGKIIDRIEAAAVPKRGEADYYVYHPDGEQPHWQTANLNSDHVAQITVRCSGRESSLTGVELSYMQFEAIVVRVTFVDGSQSRFAVNVPERGTRHLEVEIPARNEAMASETSRLAARPHLGPGMAGHDE